MLLTHPSKRLFTVLVAAILAVPVFSLPASAASAPARLDDEVSQRLQTTAETQWIPVSIEGAPDRGAQKTGAARPLAGVSARAQGAGLINVWRALAAPTPPVTRPHLPPADGAIRAVLPTLQREIGRDQGGNEGDNAHADIVHGDHVLWDQVLWDMTIYD